MFQFVIFYFWLIVFFLPRTVRRDPKISVKSSAPSLMAQTFRENSTSGSHIMEVRNKGGALVFASQIICDKRTLFPWQPRIPASWTACPEGRTFSTATAALLLTARPVTPGGGIFVWMACVRWASSQNIKRFHLMTQNMNLLHNNC